MFSLWIAIVFCAVKLGFKDISFRSNVMNMLWYLGYRLLVRNYTNSLLATNHCLLYNVFIHGQDAPGVGLTPSHSGRFTRNMWVFLLTLSNFYKQIIKNVGPNLENIDKYCPFRQHIMFMTFKKPTFKLSIKSSTLIKKSTKNKS